MRTVKEISDLTGISVRTLHYYDEIGLLKPTEKSDAGYRLYDDKALETLQQILFFREFDISLKEIKAVLDNPALERNQILQVQRKMLVTKKERMERLIASIDDILKGENKMDFTIFTKTEVEEMFQTMLEHMPENMRNIAIKEFGSIEQWKKHYMEVVSSEEMQKGYAKVVEWYGGKDKFLSVARTPVSKEVAESYNKRIEAILQKLIAKQNCDIDSFEVKELVGEYGFVMKQLAQIKEEKGFMMAQTQYYRNEQIKPMIDEKYGEGASDFFAQAMGADGVYIFDEPEAALSPQRQLTLLINIYRCAQEGAQFIIVSHSPILLGMPDAEIFSFDNGTIHPCQYEDTDSYVITKTFVNLNRMAILTKTVFRPSTIFLPRTLSTHSVPQSATSAAKSCAPSSGQSKRPSAAETMKGASMNMSSNLNYTQTGDYLLPNLTLHQPKNPLGKYGRLRRTYLMNHRPVLYHTMLLNGSLYPTLTELEQTAAAMKKQLMADLLAKNPAPDKEKNQMAWVQHMNSLQEQVEEVIRTELIYS